MKTSGKEKGLFIVSFWAIISLALFPLTTYGEIPPRINYQGYLTDATGTPVDGDVQITFSIYNHSTVGTPLTALWTETQNVTVRNGVYNVKLGDGTAFPTTLTFDTPYYLGVKVGTDPEMIPRMSLTSVPYAFRAKTVEGGGDTLSNLQCSNGQVPKWNGSAWACGSDEVGAGGLTPSSTVVNLDGNSSVGTSIEYSRGDHKHGIGNGAITSTHILDGTIGFVDIGQNGCSANQVMKWSGSAWVCAADATSGGGITAVNAGAGLTGGGTVGDVTLSANFFGTGSATAVARSDHNHDAAYVNVSGGSMTGTLTLPANGLVAGTDQLVLSGGNVGIGETSPTAKLDVRASNGYAIYALASSPGNWGVYGVNSKSGGGGIYGYATAASGYARGVYGLSASTSGQGVYGYASAASGETYGVLGLSDSPGGRGVYGYAGANSGYTMGVSGQTSSSEGTGVYGGANSASGTTFGVVGQSWSPNGIGVLGVNGGNAGTGVKATASNYGVDASGFTAVNAVSNGENGNGIIAEANNGSSAFGVWGKSSSGYAGYFSGNVQVSGTLFKANGGFKIDHPLDPTHKYLYHSFVESPDMKNIYDGVAVLDVNGEAVVTLPDWFETLNRDFRYQLTCIGSHAPVYIAEEITDNRFKISGGSPGLKVSWQVTGIRQDQWANDHRLPVEAAKETEEIGTYLYPQGFGQSDELKVEGSRIKTLKPPAQRPLEGANINRSVEIRVKP